MALLEGYRTAQGTYRFPSELLKERRNSHYLYAGSHLGLAEDRRGKQGLELESTFRMLLIRRRLREQQKYES